jgi:hypothetical protein
MTPTKQNEVTRRRISVISRTEFGRSAKHKGISPLNEKKDNENPRRLGEMTYAEVLRDEEPVWTRVQGGRRIRSRIESTTSMKDSNGRTPVTVAREKTPRRRSKMTLVKVWQDANWIDSYREVAEAKSALKETAVRRIRAGHILIEFTSKVTPSEAADNLKKAMRQDTDIVPSANRETLEIKNIDPIAKREELIADIAPGLDITQEQWIQVESIRMTPWGTQ